MMSEFEPMPRNEAPISGWLLVFLWVGAGFGGLATVVTTLSEIISNEFSVQLNLLLIASALLLAATALCTIRSFYRQSPYAVALGKTYIAMIVIDALLGMMISHLVDEPMLNKDTFRQLLWGLIWTLYLFNSNQVKRLFPAASRQWGGVGKVLLACYVLSDISILLMVWVQPSNNVMLNSRAYVESVVEANQDVLPYQIDEVTYVTGVELLGDTLRYDIQIKDLHKSDYSSQMLAETAASEKEATLSAWSEILLEDPTIAEFCRQRLTLQYRYFDAGGEHLYDKTLTYDDYKDLMPGGSLLNALPGTESAANDAEE